MKIQLSRLEQSLLAAVVLLVPALGIFFLFNWAWAVMVYGLGMILAILWIWRSQGRDPRNGRFLSKILVLSAALSALFGTGCGGDGFFALPREPGQIANQREVRRWTFAPTPPPLVYAISGPVSATQPSVQAQSPQVIVVQPSGSPLPATIETVRESNHLTQPENAAGEASLVIGGSGTSGGIKASIPHSYAPGAGLPGAATPTQKALGGLVWLGGALVAMGVLALGLRFLPWTAAVGAVIPIGVSVLVALSGGLLIAYATVLAAAPWWVIGLCVAGVVLIGFLVALRDNWKLLFAPPEVLTAVSPEVPEPPEPPATPGTQTLRT